MPLKKFQVLTQMMMKIEKQEKQFKLIKDNLRIEFQQLQLKEKIYH